MSQTDKLLSNIHEYYRLLGFLNEKYPDVLKEWSNGPTKATTSYPTNFPEGRNHEQYSATQK